MTTTTRSQNAGALRARWAGGSPTTHHGVLNWVAGVAALTTPRAVAWNGGSDSQWSTLAERVIDAGTFTALANPPSSLRAASSDSDVARVEDRTFICSPTRGEAGPTNNWVDLAEKATMTELYRGCMTGRTLYVIPFSMGPLDAPYPKLGVQLTDSEYVVGSMRIMTRVGTGAPRLLEEVGEYVQCLHLLGAPLAEGEDDVPRPCNDTKYISHFPADLAVWST